jgi:hypothetical protein
MKIKLRLKLNDPCCSSAEPESISATSKPQNNNEHKLLLLGLRHGVQTRKNISRTIIILNIIKIFVFVCCASTFDRVGCTERSFQANRIEDLIQVGQINYLWHSCSVHWKHRFTIRQVTERVKEKESRIRMQDSTED